MKKYTRPEMNIELLETVDVIATSGGEEGIKGRYLTREVNDKIGDTYGSQDVSVFG